MGLAVVGVVGHVLWARNQGLLAWWFWGQGLRFVFLHLFIKVLTNLAQMARILTSLGGLNIVGK